MSVDPFVGLVTVTVPALAKGANKETARSSKNTEVNFMTTFKNIFKSSRGTFLVARWGQAKASVHSFCVNVT
jgi:hypothetical protein